MDCRIAALQQESVAPAFRMTLSSLWQSPSCSQGPYQFKLLLQSQKT